jgi:hypothetical protein
VVLAAVPVAAERSWQAVLTLLAALAEMSTLVVVQMSTQVEAGGASLGSLS